MIIKLLVVLLCIPYGLFAAEKDLFQMSLDDLLKYKVSSVASFDSRKENETPSVVKVITSEEMNAMGAISLEEILETLSGIHIDQGGSNLPQKHIAIRGIYSGRNQQVLVLINGKRRKDQIQGAAFYYQRRHISTYNIKKIEILKGPSSSIYGADAMSGVINIITHEADENSLIAKYTRGGYSLQDVYLQYKNNSSDHKYYFSALYRDTKGNTEKIKRDSQSVFDSLNSTNVSEAPTHLEGTWKETSVELKGSYKNFNYEFFLSQYQNIKEEGIGEVIIADQKPSRNTEARGRVTYNKELSSDVAINIDLTRDHFEQRVDGLHTLFPEGANIGTGVFSDGMLAAPEFLQIDDSLDVILDYNKIKNHRFHFGAGVFHSDLVEITEKKNFNENLVPIGSVIDVTDTDKAYLPEVSRTSIHAFIQDDWSIGDMQFVYGVRWDSFNDFGETTNPRATLIYPVTEKMTTRWIYGKGFRAPILYELHSQNNPFSQGNKDLTPEKIEYYELANSYKYSNNIVMNVNLFKFQLSNIIDVDGTTYKNFGKQYGEGLEYEVYYSFTDYLKGEFNYTYLDIRDEDDAPNTKLINNQFYLGLNYLLKNNWKLNVRNHFYGITNRAVADKRENKDSYMLTHLNLVTKHLKYKDFVYYFNLKIDNIFDYDRTYTSVENAQATAEQQPSDFSAGRRALYLGLHFKI
jgi:iron complex outermembrane receptor protein